MVKNHVVSNNSKLLKVGDLVRFGLHQNSWTLCGKRDATANSLSEFPVLELQVSRLEKVFESFEGKLGLIVRVEKNHLEQPTGYQVLTGNKIWFCKSVAADKYFSLVEREEDESRGSSSF